MERRLIEWLSHSLVNATGYPYYEQGERNC